MQSRAVVSPQHKHRPTSITSQTVATTCVSKSCSALMSSGNSSAVVFCICSVFCKCCACCQIDGDVFLMCLCFVCLHVFSWVAVRWLSGWLSLSVIYLTLCIYKYMFLLCAHVIALHPCVRQFQVSACILQVIRVCKFEINCDFFLQFY